MQKFEMPKMSVEEFEIVDVVMASLVASLVDTCDDDLNCDNQTAIDW